MKVISVTPAGRRCYLEILVPYLLKNKKHIIEHHFWLNTKDQEDINYIYNLAKKYHDFFKINKKEVFSDNLLDSIWQYFQDYTDEGTIYIKLDDDICFIDKDAIPNLIHCRLKNPKPFLIYGNIVNNAICSYFHQKKGAIPLRWGSVGCECLDEIAWKSGSFSEKLHKKFISDIKRGRLQKWKFENREIGDFRRFSINAICWFGKDMKEVKETKIKDIREIYNAGIDPRTGKYKFGDNEELFLSQDLPAKINRPNEICGNALFSHFAFFMQKPFLEQSTALLEEYKSIAFNDKSLINSTRRRLLYESRRIFKYKREIYKFVFKNKK